MNMLIARPAQRVATIVIGLAAAALLLVISLPKAVQTHSASAAASSYFLKIDGIDGESTDGSHAGQIDVLSWAFGATTPTTAGGGIATGKVKFQDLHITKHIDKATPLLFKACVTGKRTPKATLYVARSIEEGTQDYYRVTFSDFTCNSFAQQGDQSDFPTETVSFNYGKILVEYLPQSRDGQPTAWTTTPVDAL